MALTSKSDQASSHDNRKRAVALQYGEGASAPLVVASGMGALAEKILEVAQENGVPIYEDNSLSAILTQLKLGQEIPEELYRAVVEIYVYFLNFRPQHSGQSDTALPSSQEHHSAEKAAT